MDEEEVKLTPIKRRHLREAAATDDLSPSEILYQHTILCQACLPYRNPGEDIREWHRSQGRASLRLQAGTAFHPDSGNWVQIGLPFGPKPRLILAHLNAEAIKTGSAEIEVEESLTAFAKQIGLSGHGRDIRTVKDQLARLAAAEIRIAVTNGSQARQVQAHIVGELNLWFPKDERQRVLWPSTVTLDPRYFESLQRHAVPLHPRALAALSHSAMGLDIYAWLSQRLHRIKPGTSQLITWKALRDQFGWQYNRIDNFRRIFKLALRDVLIHYSAARVELDEHGMTLRHSAPPILAKYIPVIKGGRPDTPQLPAPERVTD